MPAIVIGQWQIDSAPAGLDNSINLEDGDSLFLENGDALLLEG